MEHIFGYPGGAVLHVYDAIYKQKDITHILSRHEQGAIHEADGYARASGKVGVAIVTSGPGLTNAVTGIATAYADSIPLVVFSGQVPSARLATTPFRKWTRWHHPPLRQAQLPRQGRERAGADHQKAFYIARSVARPGAD